MKKGYQGGRVVLVQPNGNIVQAIEGPMLADDESDTWSVTAQGLGFVGGPPEFDTFMTVSYFIGEAQFFLQAVNVWPQAMAKPPIVRLMVNARKVIVSLQSVNIGGAVTPNVGISVGVARGATALGPEAGGFWSPGPASGPSQASYFYGNTAGKVFSVQANVIAFGGNPQLYVLLFDKGTAGVPVAGTFPIAGGRSNQMTAGNPTADFSGPYTPLPFGLGLVAALSTTPDVFTPPAGAPTFTCDVFIGVQ